MIFFYSVALLMDFQMLLSEIIVTTDLIESNEEEDELVRKTAELFSGIGKGLL